MVIRENVKFIKNGASMYLTIPSHIMKVLRLEFNQEAKLEISEEGTITITYEVNPHK